MIYAVLIAVAFLVSCAQRPAKVQKVKIKKPVYYIPVKGEIKSAGRGFFIKTKCGNFVRAVESGKVVYSGRDIESYGWVVIVEQEDGFASVYGKLGRPWVRTGERVKRRQVIGKAGKSREGCGMYYELRNSLGEPVIPVLR